MLSPLFWSQRKAREQERMWKREKWLAWLELSLVRNFALHYILFIARCECICWSDGETTAVYIRRGGVWIRSTVRMLCCLFIIIKSACMTRSLMLTPFLLLLFSSSSSSSSLLLFVSMFAFSVPTTEMCLGVWKFLVFFFHRSSVHILQIQMHYICCLTQVSLVSNFWWFFFFCNIQITKVCIL